MPPHLLEAVVSVEDARFYDHKGIDLHGIARALIEDAVARCEALGFHTIFGILLADNAASIELLEKLGFERWAELPRVAEFDGREVGHLYYGRRVS